ncbi:MAG: PD40 domain-containing protein [Planctomycetes bacterium]|nr:PD40 domain-containing protein [Planctomycetota bacterium]
MSPMNVAIPVIFLCLVGTAEAQPAQLRDSLPPGAIARLGSLRFRHDLPLRSVHYSPDGKTLLATAESYDPASSLASGGHLWDADTGKLLRRFRDAAVGSDAFFSPDGKLLVDIDNDAARVWNFATGRVIQSFGGEVDPKKYKAKTDAEKADVWKVQWAYFSDDGKTLILNGPKKDTEILRRFQLSYTGPDGELKFKELRPYDLMDLSGGSVVNFATSADARMLANENLLIDLDTGKKIRELEKPNFEYLSGLTYHFSPDGKTLVGHSFESSIGIWDIATGKLIRTFDSGRRGFRVRAQPISPDGKWIAANDGDDSRVMLFDLATGKLRWSFTNGGQHNRCWFSLDSKLIATNSDGARNICVWDIATGKEVCRVKFNFHSRAHVGNGAAFSPDGKRLAFTSGQLIRIVDLATGKILDPGAGHDEPPHALVFSADGKTLSAAGVDSGIRDWDTNTAQERMLYPDFARWASLALRRDGKLLLAYEDHWSLSVWDVRADKQLRMIDPDEAWYRHAALSADAGLIASNDARCDISIHDVATGRKLHDFTTPFSILKSYHDLPPMMAFSPDGRTFGALGWRGSAKAMLIVWELTTGKVRRRIEFDDTTGFGDWRVLGTSRGSTPLRFLPDGKTFAIITTHSVCLYSLATGKELRRFNRDGLVGFGAAFSADGRMLAGPDRNGKIFVWDTATATLLSSFDCGSTHAALVAFAPDGKRLASANSDGIVMIWDLDHFLKQADRKKPDVESAWHTLADRDAEKAFQAIVMLTQQPRDALVVLKKHFRPAALPDAKRFAALVADLNHPKFPVRQKAMREIETLEELAEPGLKKALTATTDAETRRRIQELLDRIESRPASPQLLQALRAIEVLETIGTDDAIALLRTIADGMPGYRGTAAAVAALERLGMRQ